MTYSFRPHRELARYRDSDGVSAYMTQQMLEHQVRAFARSFPEEEIIAERIEEEGCTVISAYSRVPMPLAEEEPANEDVEPEDPDVQAGRRKDAGKALLIVVLLALMLIGSVLGKVRGEVEPLPPGVLYVNPQPNGCVYETRRYDGVKWIVPQRNEAYLAGACVDARMAPVIIPDRFWELDCLATPDDRHRLWLGRDVDLPLDPVVGYTADYEMMIGLMLNPSKARGEGEGDPTQRRWHGFAKRLFAARYGFLNLFSESSPYPTDLFTFSYEDSVGEYNDEVIRRVFEQAAERNWPVVCGWGKPSLPKREFANVCIRVLDVLDLATAAGDSYIASTPPTTASGPVTP